MIDALVYWVVTYWLYMSLGLAVGLLTGWFSYSTADEREGED